MTTIATPISTKNPTLRPLNIVRDLPAVADLVEKCFADTMDTDGRNYIQQMRLAGQDNAFLRWASNAVETASMPLTGFIWEEKGEIIGNVSLIPYRQSRKKYYLIANVAVREDYRKQGIGRRLTLAAMQSAKQRHADETWLQVRDDNPGAIELYRSLGFIEVVRRTSWQTLPDQKAGSGSTIIKVTKRFPRDWPTQEAWLKRLYPEMLTWYQPMPWISLRPGFGPALYRFISDYEVRHWVVRTDNNPTAVVSCQVMAGRSNRLWVAIPQVGNSEILTALLIHARQEKSGREKILLDFPAEQEISTIEAAGFQKQRTLVWMKSDETSVDKNRKSI
jgi:GNAT superfamily N-acetyltransferase